MKPSLRAAFEFLPPALRLGIAALSGLLILALVRGWPPLVDAILALVLGGLFGWLAGRSQPISAHRGSTDGGSSPPSLASLVAAIDLPAMALNASRHVTAHNRQAADLFPGLADGQPLAMVSRNPELLQAIERAPVSGRAESAEITGRMLYGRRLLVTAAPLPGTNALLLQFRDTSEQARLAQLRSDFIANASHELRTPLASIRGFIETLQGPARADEAARMRFLGIMEAQAARMNRILDDLLSLSRIEMRAHLPPEGEVDVADVTRHALRGLEPLAREADIRLTLLPVEGEQRVRGDRDELEQVVQNLVHNAIKYGRPGGKVDVAITRRPRTGHTPENITIRVADDGPGIPAEHLPRLTERFYRVDTARSRERGGTGLGLAIVKHILNRHRGELEIASELGRGSTFTIVLEALAE